MLSNHTKIAFAVLALLTFSNAGLAWGEEFSSRRVEFHDNVITCGGCFEDLCDSIGCDNSCCCGSLASCDGCCDGLLGGWILPSDHCYDDFISPMTNPIFFEDPRNLTEVRLIFMNQWLTFVLGEKDMQYIGTQVRAALTDRLSLTMTKAGFIIAEGANPLHDGWADVALGLKYNMYADPCSGTLLSAGASYELPVGSSRTFQGNGDGEFHLYLTGGQRLGQQSHWLSASGFRLPADTVAENQVWYWSNHLDRHMGRGFYLLGEVNWYHTMTSGGYNALNNFNGVDLFNFGAPNTAGTDIVTGALGVKYKPSGNYEIGVAYEVARKDRRSAMDDRLTIDFIWRY